jgi:hypothetical protein
MPEFIMPLGDHSLEYAVQFQRKQIDGFTRGYIEALFWTECNSDNPELEDCSINDLSPEAWETILRDCRDYQELNADDLECYCFEYSDEYAGHDFWLTRNGHGAGFWDRDTSDDLTKEMLDRLSANCGWKSRNNPRPFPETDLYLGDDGKLYLS